MSLIIWKGILPTPAVNFYQHALLTFGPYSIVSSIRAVQALLSLVQVQLSGFENGLFVEASI